MSTTTERVPLARAQDQIVRLQALFPVGTFACWHVAGSVRRERPEVGDVEHVVIPAMAEVPVAAEAGLFPGAPAPTETVNLFWRRVDELVGARTLTKAVYGERPWMGEVPEADAGDPPASWTHNFDRQIDRQIRADRGLGKPAPGHGVPVHRWGEKYRGVVFEGVRHELFLADPRNFGAILAIRTGPDDFSKKLVAWVKHNTVYRQEGGYLVYKRDGAVRAVETEEAYFEAVGLRWVPPENRCAAAIRWEAR